MLLTAGADVNICDDNGDAPLNIAVANHDVDIAELLLRNSANVNIMNDGGNTSLLTLMMTCDNTQVHIVLQLVTLMLQYGADANVRNNDGLCASDYFDDEMKRMLSVHI